MTDNAGITGTATSGFDVCVPDQPMLGLTRADVYWNSYADYLARLLSVDYVINNEGTSAAYAVAIIGSVDSNGVSMASAAPITLGNIAPEASAQATVKYNVPEGVTGFRSSVYATAQDACGASYYYPGPMPQAGHLDRRVFIFK